MKCTSSSYVQNVIENMVLMSYLDKPYFVASWDEMLHSNDVAHQERGQFLLRDKFILSDDITFNVALMVTLYHDYKTSKCCNRCILV